MKHLQKTFWAGWIAIVVVTFSFAVSAATKKVDHAFVSAGDIILKCQDFCNVKLAEAPAPGQRKVLLARDVEAPLARAGFTVAKRKIPNRVTVIRKSRNANTVELTQLVQQSIKNVLSNGAHLEQMGKITSGKVPTGDWAIRAVFDSEKMYQRTISIPVEFHSGGVVFRKIFVMCKLSYLVKVPVAAKAIARGEILTPQAIRFTEKKTDDASRKIPLHMDQIAGFKSRVSMQPGDTFEARHLENVPVVRRGDAVTVMSAIRGIRISARGFARQDAVKGQRIAVEIPSLNKLLFAKIVSAGLGVVQR